MSDEKEEQSFRVIDKRRFNDQGDPKAENLESRRDPEASIVSEKAAEKSTQSTMNAKNAASSKAQPAAQSAAEYADSGTSERVEFASFVVSLATQALSLLGEIPNPESGEMFVSFEAARQTIDILGMLEEKTKGNLIPEEERLLSEVLSSLRMAYVNKVRKGA